MIVIPEAAVSDFVFAAEANSITTTNATSLSIGAIVKIGDRIVKIADKTIGAASTQYSWDVATLDEAYDEINVSVDVLEATVPVLNSGKAFRQAVGLECRPYLVGTVSGAGGVKVDCKVPVAGGSSLGIAATATIKYEGIKIIKTGKGSPATQEWKLTLQVDPEVGLRWKADDVLNATPADKILKSIPECATQGVLNTLLGRPLSTPPAYRGALGSLPVATSGVMTLSVPACILVDAGDSKIGLDIIGKAKWKLTAIKLKEAELPTVSSDFQADMVKAIADTVVGLNATAVLKGRLELTPMLHFGFVPVSGLYLNPGIDITAAARATPLKQGICVKVDFKSDADYWVPGLRNKLPGVLFTLVEDQLLLGDTCNPTDPAPLPPPPPPLACDASFDPYLNALPAFASQEVRNTVDGARKDAAILISVLGSPPEQLSSWIASVDQQTAQYRSTQTQLETLYTQFAVQPALGELCRLSVSAPSSAQLVDSIAVAWGTVRIGTAFNTWSTNALQCKLTGGTYQPKPLERYCPY